MRKILATTLLTFFSVTSVYAAEDTAGFFIEPLVTIETTKTDAPFGASGEARGLGIGARLGFHVSDAIFVGVDGRFSRLKYVEENSTFNYDGQANAYNIAPVVGVQMPDIGLRVWAGYIVAGEMNPESGSVDLKMGDGTGYRIGAGFRVKSVSLNLEYQKLNYGNADVNDGGLVSESFELDNDTWIASVSFPLAL